MVRLSRDASKQDEARELLAIGDLPAFRFQALHRYRHGMPFDRHSHLA
jgi:hypothetical protein